MSLEELMRRAKVWRAGEVSSEAGLATGFPALDALLPARGWPSPGLIEILTDYRGIGALRLLVPALARLSQQQRWLIWVAPPHIPYAPALQQQGVELSRVLIVETGEEADPGSAADLAAGALWTFEQALRFPGCGASLAWLDALAPLALRRLQLACEAGGTLGVIFRPARRAGQPSPAVLRLVLAPAAGEGLCVHILKCRGSLREQDCHLIL